MTSTLPSPRDLLTSLITALTSTTPTATTVAPHPASTTDRGGGGGAARGAGPGRGPGAAGPSASGNPLNRIPPASRPFLTTLHVLYPSTLLPALDLLDRRLVTRIIVVAQEPVPPSPPPPPPPPQAGPGQVTVAAEAESETHPRPEERRPVARYHLVRSAQPLSSRRSASTTASGPTYVVRLDAWNCTCAAFAFAAFPAEARSGHESGYGSYYGGSSPLASLGWDGSLGEGGKEGEEEEEEEEEEWQFGGLSADGRDDECGITGVPPCCKHLLACVLAERWEALLGGYVAERIVGREEAAGLVGDV